MANFFTNENIQISGNNANMLYHSGYWRQTGGIKCVTASRSTTDTSFTAHRRIIQLLNVTDYKNWKPRKYSEAFSAEPLLKSSEKLVTDKCIFKTHIQWRDTSEL